MDTIQQQLNILKSDLSTMRLHCEKMYEDVTTELHEKEDMLKKLYEHNLKLVKEKNDIKAR